MINSAGIPKMWVFKDALRYPWKSNETDLPNPHPGQYSNPAFANGHIVKWVSNGLTKNAK